MGVYSPRPHEFHSRVRLPMAVTFGSCELPRRTKPRSPLRVHPGLLRPGHPYAGRVVWPARRIGSLTIPVACCYYFRTSTASGPSTRRHEATPGTRRGTESPPVVRAALSIVGPPSQFTWNPLVLGVTALLKRKPPPACPMRPRAMVPVRAHGVGLHAILARSRRQ